MHDFTIDVGRVEELQMINDVGELDKMFQKAKTAIVCGAIVHLTRKNKGANPVAFEHLTTLADLNLYKDTVYKYVKNQ